jgi:hypothetical protein
MVVIATPCVSCRTAICSAGGVRHIPAKAGIQNPGHFVRDS